ncbi:quinone oxidoreductase family protein [Acidocella aminolytica]|uniref:Alcohol dehydrogenase n=1 Tax=Acidocella aminolytica 101 = DSM 11237 TaxID=1120923 RepID=A0A0D6PM01_9PROT|nr:quinone oxidoreductase [Acidocella aminolytica]GAN81819.1 alcohol dehydrogenase [Acidocella aminolytica 101 = DSM 11237]GBQ39168.1 zinc-dependent alcohol dehydrogenase [Acidocella aminolytica 101 = DSM 11237]SHF57930.1 NADPH2:quinone reductase [Acidocella aminolytica 101 = DSM 11237]
MSKAIRIHAHGGPEVLKWEQVPTPQPGPNEALIRHEAVGLNFIDIYFRTGLYKANLPSTLGMEGAGVVLAVGENVQNVAPGDRVAYAGGPLGAYSTERVINAEKLVKLPEGIDTKTAGAMMLQGLTAYFLLHRTFKVQAGQTILVHAAAGGVGLILCQWAKHLGANVIGVVSSEAKAEIARGNGAAHVIVGHTNLAAEVKQITSGAMVPVVYDSVGKDTFNASLDSLAPLGLMVSFGNASGPIPPFDIATLSTKGSLFLTRPGFSTYMSTAQDISTGSTALFSAVLSGALHISVNQSFPLEDAATAHTALEARKTTGSTVLIP